MDKTTGIFIIAIIILMATLASYGKMTELKGELASSVRLSTSQEDWKKCRMEVWEGCGLGNSYEKVIQSMNARYDRRDKETLKYVEPLISYCWNNVAEYKCDARFDMKNKK